MARRNSDHDSAAELRRVRALLGEAAEFEDVPQRNVVRGAVSRLRARHTAIVHVNELLNVLVAVMRGWTTLIAVDEIASNDAGSRSTKATEGGFRG